MDRETRYVLGGLPQPHPQHRGRLYGLRAGPSQRPESARRPSRRTVWAPTSMQSRRCFPKDHSARIVSKGIRHEINNNMAERLQKTFRSRIKTMDGLEMRRTAQDYLDGWVLDYNFFKDHRAHRGATPAEIAGVADDVPWDDWGDITRLGGEVAESEVKESRILRKKPGPKPKPEDAQKMIEQSIKEYHDKQATKTGHLNWKKATVVAPFPKKKKPASRGGRGKKGMKL